MTVQACINGARALDEHPRLSADPHALAREARTAVDAGATSLHVHPKRSDGGDTLDPGPVAEVIAAVRATCPGTPVGITTGAWALPDPQARVTAIRAWTILPDFASVNWHETGADDVARALSRRGIHIEAGIWNTDGLNAWTRSALSREVLRVLIELPAVAAGTDLADHVSRLAHPLIEAVQAHAPDVPILLHGEDASTWPAITLAHHLGIQTRVGLEDTLTLPNGHSAKGNADLVKAALGPAKLTSQSG